MRMKKYQASSMAEAIAQIRAELGPNAVIVHASESRKGLLGKAMVEVVAAVDGSERSARGATGSAGAPPVAGRSNPPTLAGGRGPHARAPAGQQPRSGGTAAQRAAAVAERRPAAGPDPITAMEQQVVELRSALTRLSHQWAGAGKLAPPLAELHQRLLEQEVEPGLAQQLVTTIDGELSLQAASDQATVLDTLSKHLRRMLPTTGPLGPKAGEPTIVFLIGPTGVGKTTTIAKLAANMKVQRRRMTLITCDTYRIAAIPQLRTYADILRVPLEVAYTPEELTSKVLDHLDDDFVIVDTPGRSQRNADQLADLRRFVQAVPTRRTLLTIAAGARYRDMLDVVARFGAIPFDGLLLTKLDETTTFGPILNLLHHTGKPLTYLTTGQNVPQDIELATAGGLAEMLVRSAYAAEVAA